MRLLITGGAGFIGSNFIRYMIEKYPHYQIVNLDLLTYAGSREKLKDVESHPHYAFVQGNICDSRLVDALVSGKSEAYGTTAPAPVDVIVNFAAESHVDRSIADPGVFIRTNLVGTHVLLESARTYKVKKFVQISTDEVYGSLGDTGCFTEESPLSPNNPYSASKAGADLLVRAYHETYGLPVNITRCSNNFGPYQHPEKLIPLMTTNALLGKKLPIYGDGGHVRDWLHVADHCSAVDLVIHSGRPGEIYNIGGNNEHKNSEIVRKILAVLQKPESLIEFVEDRPGHDRRYAINADKIRRELGWRPVYEFATALRETVLWYKNRL
ncbi:MULTISPECIES: dTDP-glucose 4,6-dehydratase [Brevibacillus]|jgi:dTDP-glucose 4,6-dehydratase|uniref:dTDP-glucose 4,6-dehydratase n=1 Tax=Brevibacillus TaxID=55080 RepID=UPI0004F38AF7|nr:dTDP-glucose 4,6-dehydratase [Brevibacillus borstelensis]KKX53200.1 spore coat protein [Brevibacillus borstelensis cifa_chp40]MBE5394266.1 dTDP-glucose 4,6-dehydratase [Brevibacillus borstelensis]MCM3622417.1 dTDP-glucose 4,6-dehydratase [Brevibacillus borstelensis]MED1745411.1 dTDP-glucose 4,6-dehydratase [Brevibacillus borstelensis]MED1854782.1 dTDP-glucose 4,6-dehydratase [Brevibacillus borstelensis]